MEGGSGVSVAAGAGRGSGLAGTVKGLAKGIDYSKFDDIKDSDDEDQTSDYSNDVSGDAQESYKLEPRICSLCGVRCKVLQSVMAVSQR